MQVLSEGASVSQFHVTSALSLQTFAEHCLKNVHLYMEMEEWQGHRASSSSERAAFLIPGFAAH